MCELTDGEWCPRGVGGRLFLADGLFDISYGPKDVVLLDGNIVHGITGLRDTPGKGMATRRELAWNSATEESRHHMRPQPLFGTLEISEQRRQKEHRARRFGSTRRLGSLLDVGAQVVAAGAGHGASLMPGAAARSVDSSQPGGGAGLEWWQRELQAPPPQRADGASRWQQAWLYRVRSDQYPDHAPAVPFEWLRRPQAGADVDVTGSGAGAGGVHSKEVFLDRVQKGFVHGRNCT